MAFDPSPEQERLASQQRGFVLGVANAGSGKTKTGAELFRRLFRIERKLRYRGYETLTAPQVQDILRLFFLTSFTVKQSADFDRQIKQVLREENAEIPVRGGAEIRICRTLDSHLGLMLCKPSFFRAWSGLLNSWPNALASLVEKLSPAARDSLRIGKDGAALDGVEQVLKFYYRYSPVLTGDQQLMVAEAFVRKLSGPRLPAKLEPETVIDGFYRSLGTVDALSQKWCADYWEGVVNIWREEHLRHKELHDHFDRITASKESYERKALKDFAQVWYKSFCTAEKFLNLYQIARTRGYDPLFNARFLGSQAFLEAFASTDGLENESVGTFHQWATDYALFKLKTGLLDFTDRLDAFVRVMSTPQGVSLMEYRKADPLFGFRRRYCIWDEGQDFTPKQIKMVRIMAAPDEQPGMTLVLGDGKQSLYAFAGASPYEFARMVKEEKSKGDFVFTLTSNFRSARKIVEIANEISMTLPSYAKSVMPSIPHYSEDGEVSVSPPLNGDEDEASWIIARIDALLSTGETSIMVVFRNDPDGHPISRLLKDDKYKSVELLTIHRSKGLEARHVFVGGCTSGRFPLPIGDTLGRNWEEKKEVEDSGIKRPYNDQEINLFYVGATRARWSLTFSAPIYLRTIMQGSERNEFTGPSPFFWEVPSLRKLCLESGWTEQLLTRGVSKHEDKVATFYKLFHGRIWSMSKEAKDLGLKPGIQEENESKDRDDTVKLGLHELLNTKGGSHHFAGAPARLVAGKGGKVDVAEDDVLKKYKKSYFNNAGRPPKQINHAERDLAFRRGWLEMSGDGKLVFSSAFKEQFRPK